MSREEQDHAMNTDQKLVYMANQIATFFVSQPRGEQAKGLADHINAYWEPRMRRRFFEVAAADPDALAPLVQEALGQIRRPKDAGD